MKTTIHRDIATYPAGAGSPPMQSRFPCCRVCDLFWKPCADPGADLSHGSIPMEGAGNRKSRRCRRTRLLHQPEPFGGERK